MFFVVKYFRRNHFSEEKKKKKKKKKKEKEKEKEKDFSNNIFRPLAVRKNHQRHKMESGDVRPQSLNSAQIGQNLVCRNQAKSLDYNRNLQIPTKLVREKQLESDYTG